MRFVLNLYRLNNKDGSLRITRDKNPFEDLPKQDKLVEVLKWSLLDNHYHLLLYEKIEGGIVEFVKRIGNAYTKYSNIKNSGSGYIFQNSAKIIPLETHQHYLYIPFYIDMNPSDLLPGFKSKRQLKKTFEFLENYEWSSFRDYFGKQSKFDPIINKELFYELFDTDAESYKKELEDLLNREEIFDFEELVNLTG